MFFSIIFSVFVFIRTVNSSDQAFIQINNELRYMMEDITENMYEHILEDDTFDHSEESKEPLVRFHPPALNFHERPLGMPYTKRVTIENRSHHRAVNMLSISGSTVHFHCTFFEDKLVAPMSNTSLEVIFLGRELGAVTSAIYIHTSVGSYKFQLQATGIANPYRLKPLVGVKVPLNSSYTPLIELYNPFTTPLQMYTSGSDLHLELPSGGASSGGVLDAATDRDASGAQWRIAPYSSQPLMRANFVARSEYNHTAFIRIKTNISEAHANSLMSSPSPSSSASPSLSDDYLVVPVEVEVTSQPGLFSAYQKLDFGMVPAATSAAVDSSLSSSGLTAAVVPPISLPIALFNSARKAVYIQQVAMSTASKVMSVQFQPVTVPPTTVRPVSVARVTLNPDLIDSQHQISGRILIKSQNGQYKLHVPYSADVVPGRLSYNASRLQFLAASVDALRPRIIDIHNQFTTPLAINNCSLPPDDGRNNASRVFELRCGGARVLAVNQSASVFTVGVRPGDQSARSIHTHVLLHTNITQFRLPLSYYTGKLTVITAAHSQSSQEEHADGVAIDTATSLLHFGTVPVSSKSWIVFRALNDNPVPVRLVRWRVSPPRVSPRAANTTSQGQSDEQTGASSLRLMSVQCGADAAALTSHDDVTNTTYDNRTANLTLLPGCSAEFGVIVTSPAAPGLYSGACTLSTDLQPSLHVPYRLHVAHGALMARPRAIIFNNTFPGGEWSSDVQIHSTFAHLINISSAHFASAAGADDSSLSFVPVNADQTYSSSSASSVPPPPPGWSVTVSSDAGWLTVGRVLLRPALGCDASASKSACYCGFPLHSRHGARWLEGVSLPPTVGQADSAMYHSLHQRFSTASVPRDNATWHTRLTLVTDSVRSLHVPIHVRATWPSVLAPSGESNLKQQGQTPAEFSTTQRRKLLDFGAVHVDEVSVITVRVYNPSQRALFFQLVLLSDYPATQATMDVLQQILGETVQKPSSSDRQRIMFSLLNDDHLEQDPDVTLSQDTTAAGDNTCDHHLSSPPVTAPASIFGCIAAQASRNFTVVFRPSDERQYSDTLIIRNNLTVLDAIAVRGGGGRVRLTLAQRDINDSSPFIIHLDHSHLHECTRSGSQLRPPRYTVKRLFNARNTGSLPLRITDYRINGAPCIGYGFRVLDCRPQLLPPNSSVQVALAFTPDFTVSSVRRRLELHLSPVTVSRQLAGSGYKSAASGDKSAASGGKSAGRRHDSTVAVLRLHVRMPRSLLLACQAAVPRPSWEPLIYYAVVSLALFCTMCTLVLAYVESQRVLRHVTALKSYGGGGAMAAHRHCAHQPLPSTFAVFDLAGIVRRTRCELETAVSPSTSSSTVTSQECASPAGAAGVHAAAAASKEQDEYVLRRRRLRKEAKSRRSAGGGGGGGGGDGWTSQLLASLDMATASAGGCCSSSSCSSSSCGGGGGGGGAGASATVIEDVAVAGVVSASPGSRDRRAAAATAAVADSVRRSSPAVRHTQSAAALAPQRVSDPAREDCDSVSSSSTADFSCVAEDSALSVAPINKNTTTCRVTRDLKCTSSLSPTIDASMSTTATAAAMGKRCSPDGRDGRQRASFDRFQPDLSDWTEAAQQARMASDSSAAAAAVSLELPYKLKLVDKKKQVRSKGGGGESCCGELAGVAGTRARPTIAPIQPLCDSLAKCPPASQHNYNNTTTAVASRSPLPLARTSSAPWSQPTGQWPSSFAHVVSGGSGVARSSGGVSPCPPQSSAATAAPSQPSSSLSRPPITGQQAGGLCWTAAVNGHSESRRASLMAGGAAKTDTLPPLVSADAWLPPETAVNSLHGDEMLDERSNGGCARNAVSNFGLGSLIGPADGPAQPSVFSLWPWSGSPATAESNTRPTAVTTRYDSTVAPSVSSSLASRLASVWRADGGAQQYTPTAGTNTARLNNNGGCAGGADAWSGADPASSSSSATAASGHSVLSGLGPWSPLLNSLQPDWPDFYQTAATNRNGYVPSRHDRHQQ